jgi:hydrogenase expression/formation protein HypC
MCLAVPGQIVSIEGNDPLELIGKVSFGGTMRKVNLSCVPEALIGDYVLVHAGMAISIIDASEAELTYQYLKEIDDLATAEDEANEIS